ALAGRLRRPGRPGPIRRHQGGLRPAALAVERPEHPSPEPPEPRAARLPCACARPTDTPAPPATCGPGDPGTALGSTRAWLSPAPVPTASSTGPRGCRAGGSRPGGPPCPAPPGPGGHAAGTGAPGRSPTGAAPFSCPGPAGP